MRQRRDSPIIREAFPAFEMALGWVLPYGSMRPLTPLSWTSNASMEHGTFARASRELHRGELVELIPTLPIPHRARYTAFDHDALYRLVYPWDFQKTQTVVGLGYSAGYAYSPDPNTSIRQFGRNVLMASATRTIMKGEVITRHQPFSQMPTNDLPLPSHSGSWITRPSFPIALRERVLNLGFGVKASRSIRAGEIIEVCPVIVFTGKSVPSSGKMGLGPYVFDWREVSKKRSNLWHPRAIALGYGSLYEHSNRQPNAYVERNGQYNGYSGTIVFRALREIDAGEKITHNYRESGVGSR